MKKITDGGKKLFFAPPVDEFAMLRKYLPNLHKHM
jgi:hypothetical protein